MSEALKQRCKEFVGRFPEFEPEWAEHEEWWEGGNGAFNDADQIAGYVLDALVYRTKDSQEVAVWLENSYGSLGGKDIEAFEVGILEELVERLHFVWDKHGSYEEKLQIVLASLLPNTKAWVVNYLSKTGGSK